MAQSISQEAIGATGLPGATGYIAVKIG